MATGISNVRRPFALSKVESRRPLNNSSMCRSCPVMRISSVSCFALSGHNLGTMKSKLSAFVLTLTSFKSSFLVYFIPTWCTVLENDCKDTWQTQQLLASVRPSTNFEFLIARFVRFHFSLCTLVSYGVRYAAWDIWSLQHLQLDEEVNIASSKCKPTRGVCKSCGQKQTRHAVVCTYAVGCAQMRHQ